MKLITKMCLEYLNRQTNKEEKGMAHSGEDWKRFGVTLYIMADPHHNSCV